MKLSIPCVGIERLSGLESVNGIRPASRLSLAPVSALSRKSQVFPSSNLYRAGTGSQRPWELYLDSPLGFDLPHSPAARKEGAPCTGDQVCNSVVVVLVLIPYTSMYVKRACFRRQQRSRAGQGMFFACQSTQPHACNYRSRSSSGRGEMEVTRRSFSNDGWRRGPKPFPRRCGSQVIVRVLLIMPCRLPVFHGREVSTTRYK